MDSRPLDSNQAGIFSYEELEFFAEETLLEIIPTFSLPDDGSMLRCGPVISCHGRIAADFFAFLSVPFLGSSLLQSLYFIGNL